MEEGKNNLGRVCVTGGTGYVGSWLIMRLLQRGYYVNATVRSSLQGSKKDLSYLTNLPGASEKLQIFNADLNNPDSFREAIEGCIGVFHVSHPMEFEGKETEETITRRSVDAILGILQLCLDAKTVKKVVYTSSTSAVLHNKDTEGLDEIVDENSWTDVDYARDLNNILSPYIISKTLTEKAALEFTEKNGLDLVTVIPPFINGPFITTSFPGSVQTSLAMILGNGYHMIFPKSISFVHVDDIASAHMFLFEYPEAKGRYICSAVDIKIDELYDLFSRQYPQYPLLVSKDSLAHDASISVNLSSEKLLSAGFTFKHSIEGIFYDAIKCCKQKGFM